MRREILSGTQISIEPPTNGKIALWLGTNGSIPTFWYWQVVDRVLLICILV